MNRLGAYDAGDEKSPALDAYGASRDADAGAIGYALAALKDWIFILGPGFVVGVGNGLILGYLMY